MQQVNALPAQSLDLKDIHLPEQISNYPVAYGWWILAALIIFILVMAILKINKVKKINYIKKQALAQLKNNEEMNISETISLLKWAAMHYFPRVDIAKIFGVSLQSFLANKLPLKHQQKFTELSEEAFLSQYKASESNERISISTENINEAAKLWLTNALPPKAIKIKSNERGITS